MAKVLMTLRGSQLLSNSWKQELVITDEGVEGEVLRSLKRVKMRLPYDRIAQVNLVRNILRADIEVVNKGGTDNLVIRALPKQDAERARELIEKGMRSSIAQPPSPQSSVADELAKLASLKGQGHITEGEFETQKKRLLGS